MRVPSSPTAPVESAPPEETVHLGYLASLFIGFGLLGLLTALIMAIPTGEIFSGWIKYSPGAAAESEPLEVGEQFQAFDYSMVGPFTISRPGQVIWVSVSADVAVNKWVFIEGELLDAEQNFLMGFGGELWHETGYDDGPWDEKDIKYDLHLTVPEAGTFYLNFKTQGELPRPDRIRVKIYCTLGSSMPHLIYGVIVLLAGLVLNEIANQTIIRIGQYFGKFR